MALHHHGLLVPLVSGQACAAAEHHGRRSVVQRLVTWQTRGERDKASFLLFGFCSA